MTRRTRIYDLADYTDHGVLRIPPALWIAIGYLCRQTVVIVIVAVSSLAARRGGFDLEGLTALAGDPVEILASIPALLVVWAATRRVPAAGALPRRVWRHGRWLLVLAALLDLGFLYLRLPGRLSQWSLLHLPVPLLDGYVLVYLLRSRRAADTFAGFPAAGAK